MIGRTWDKQMETYASQPDGLLKEAGGYLYVYIWIKRKSLCICISLSFIFSELLQTGHPFPLFSHSKMGMKKRSLVQSLVRFLLMLALLCTWYVVLILFKVSKWPNRDIFSFFNFKSFDPVGYLSKIFLQAPLQNIELTETLSVPRPIWRILNNWVSMWMPKISWFSKVPSRILPWKILKKGLRSLKKSQVNRTESNFPLLNSISSFISK